MGDQPDSERKLFGNLVRKLRDAKGMTRDQLGTAIGHTGSTVANIECGYRAPTPAQAASLDQVFALPGVLTEVEEKLRGLSFSAGFRPFAPLEAEALVLRYFGAMFVPGLFQTEDYARAILSTHPDATPELVAERLDARMERQKLLSRKHPPRLWVLLDPLVLTREIGGPKIAADQLRHLANLAARPNITMQILATHTHSALTGAFAIAELPGRRVAYMETTLDGTTTEDPTAVAALESRLDKLRTDALRGNESLELIERAIDEHERMAQVDS